MGDDKRCRMCRELVVGQAVNVGDAIYHPACFMCSNCHAVLGSEFVEQGGRRVCPDCVKRPTCKICKKEVNGACLEIEADKYHPECARCEACSALLGDEYGRVRGLLSCRACMRAAKAKPSFASKLAEEKASSSALHCKRCSRSIDGPYVFGDPEDAFHEECFTCAKCSCALSDFAVDDSGSRKLYLCGSCFEDANPSTDVQGEPAEIAEDPDASPGMDPQQSLNEGTDVVACSDSSEALPVAAEEIKKRISGPSPSCLKKVVAFSTANASDLERETSGTSQSSEASSRKSRKSVQFSGKQETLEYCPSRPPTANGPSSSFETEQHIVTQRGSEGQRCADRCANECAIS